MIFILFNGLSNKISDANDFSGPRNQSPIGIPKPVLGWSNKSLERYWDKTDLESILVLPL